MHDLLLTLLSIPCVLPILFFFPTCVCCPSCPGCTAIPESYQVTISGMANDQCTNCAGLNATFVLTRIACEWHYEGGDTLGCSWGRNFHMYLWTQLVGSDYITTFFVGTCQNDDSMVYTYNHGTTKPDCTAFSGLSLAFDAAQTAPGACGLGGKGCNGSGATVTVTAL